MRGVCSSDIQPPLEYYTMYITSFHQFVSVKQTSEGFILVLLAPLIDQLDESVQKHTRTHTHTQQNLLVIQQATSSQGLFSFSEHHAPDVLHDASPTTFTSCSSLLQWGYSHTKQLYPHLYYQMGSNEVTY